MSSPSVIIESLFSATVEAEATTYQNYQQTVLGWNPVSMFDLRKSDFYDLETGQLGTVNGGLTYVRAPNLKMNADNLANFDGIDDYVDISYVTGNVESSTWTIEFWAKHTTTGPYIYVEDSVGAQKLLVTPSETQGQVTGSPAPTNSYTHIALVCDGSNITRYHNANLNDTITGSVSLTNTDVMYVGYDGTNFIESEIGGLAIYDYAISVNRIEQNYSVGSSGEYKFTHIDIDSTLNLSEQSLDAYKRVWTIRPA